MRNIDIPFIDILRPFALGLSGLIILVFFVLFRLGSMTPGISPAEVPTVQIIQSRSLSARDIVREEQLFLPYKAGLYTLEKLGFTTVAAIRGIGAIFGLIGAVAFYLLLLKWHTRRIAFLGTFLLASSSWFLHAARLASPETTYLLLPMLFYLGAKLEQGNQRTATVAAAVLAAIGLLYVPGFVWFIVPGIIWQHNRIRERLNGVSRPVIISLGLVTLFMLAPLVYGLLSGGVSFTAWLGWNRVDTSLLQLLKDTVLIPVRIFALEGINPATHLGRLPLLDVATTVLVGLGVYWYFFHRTLDRTKLLAAGLIIGTLLSVVINPDMPTLLLPFVYALAAAGITFLLQQWFTVFPRNPLARSTGIVLVVAVVGMIGFYHLRRYFVAWTIAPETRAVYSQRI